MKPTTKTLRCAIYARVSSDRQDVENSLDRQHRACREWTERNGHQPAEVFTDEAKSGASMLARPAFQRLLSLLRSRDPLPFDAVLVDDDSRLDRGGHMASIVEAFQARRVRLISVDSGRDLTDENERLLVHVKSGLNEHYLHELARRTREGLKSKVLHGYHAGGRIYGYRLRQEWPPGLAPEQRRADNKIGTRIEVNEDEAKIVLRIFEAYAIGGIGFRNIAVALNEDGIPSSRGKPSWDASSVRVILRNQKYTGDWSWNRRHWRKVPEALLSEAEREQACIKGRHPRRPTTRPAEDLIEKRHDALRIVPDDLWRRVQARFVGRARTTKGSNGHQRTRSPIAGLLTCSCGGAIGVATNKAKGHTYSRLLCAWNRNRGDQVCANSTVMRMDAVAEPLLQFVREELLAPKRVGQAVDLVNQKIEAMMRGTAASPTKVSALESEVTRLEAEVSRLVEALAKGTAYEAISAALSEKDRRLKAARAELATLTRPTPLAKVPRVTVKDVTDRLQHLWEDVQALDGDRSRLALAQFFERITVTPLDGAWKRGWRLEMRTRPPVVLPRGAMVAQIQSCGGRI
jgi:site-specific DNA recombinase